MDISVGHFAHVRVCLGEKAVGCYLYLAVVTVHGGQ